MESLTPEHQHEVAFFVYRTYGGPLTVAQRQAIYRVRHSNARVMESPPGSHASVTSESNDRVTENGNLPNVVLEASVSSNRKLREQATEVLKFLNEKTSRSFRYVDSTLRPIEARLKSGASVQDCKSVIAKKTRDWSSDEKMHKFLRPETIFNPTKFESYLGELGS